MWRTQEAEWTGDAGSNHGGTYRLNHLYIVKEERQNRLVIVGGRGLAKQRNLNKNQWVVNRTLTLIFRQVSASSSNIVLGHKGRKALLTNVLR